MMSLTRFSYLYLSGLCFLGSGCSRISDTQPPYSSQQLMTASDILNSAESNISIRNATSSIVIASGLYIASFDANDCSACYGSILSGNNAGGTFVQLSSFMPGESVKIGQNYLYNLIYNGLNYVRQSIGSPCNLPGCSWPGDTSSLKWCISLGVMSRNSAYTSSLYTNGSYPAANVVPYAQAVKSTPFQYNYSLVDPNTLGIGTACLGPITCNDQSLTCTVSTPQIQAFQGY